MTQRIEHFLDMTRRIEPFWMWLKELKFSTENDSKNGFFGMWLKELNRIFKNLTQRIEHSSLGDSKNWTSSQRWLKELNPFLNMTHRNFSELQLEDFSYEICLTKLKELNLLFTNVSKNWTFFEEKNMTHRTEPFFHVTHGIEPFFPTWVIEIEPFFLHDSKNWTLLFWIWLKELNFFFEYWLKELNFLFLENDAKNWTFFLGYDAKIDPSLLNFDTNQRIEPSFQKWLKEFNFLLELCLKELNFFFFWKKWLGEMILQLTPKSNFLEWLKFLKGLNLFSIWLKELNFLFDSKNWTFFFWLWLKILTSKWLEELRPFCNLTQRIEPSLWIWLKKRTFFSVCLHELNLFSKNFTPRIELCKNYDTKNWTLSFFFFWRNLTQRFDFFWNSNNGTLFQKYDFKNWTFFELWEWNSFTNMAFFKNSTLLNLFIWFNELDPFYMTLRIEPFFSARLKEFN